MPPQVLAGGSGNLLEKDPLTGDHIFRDLSPAPVTCDSSFRSDYSISFIPVECDSQF